MTDAALGLAARVAPSIGPLLQGTDDLQQMSVRYPDSPLNEDHLSGLAHLLQRGPKPGDRAPEAEVTRDGATTSLFAYLYNPDGRTTGWALLGFDGRAPDAGDGLRAAVAAVAPWGHVRPRLVLAGPLLDIDDVPVLSDLDGKAHGTYGLEGQPALLLIRPDGHIAFRDAADRHDRLTAYCRRIFAPGRACRPEAPDAGRPRPGCHRRVGCRAAARSPRGSCESGTR